MTAIAAALSSFKILTDISKSMIDLRDAQAFQSKVIEFQGAILNAQSSLFAANEERSALIDKVGALEKENAALRSWESERAKYVIKPVGRGAFAYVLNDTVGEAEGAFWLCTTCFDRGSKSILQFFALMGRNRVHKCHVCGTLVTVTS